jgi:glutathione S-transferase
MVQYKLNFYNIRGRGEVIRLIFVAAGQKYEDHRFDFDQWSEYKEKAPLGTCPWLEIDDEHGHVTYLGQSITIGNIRE